MRVCSWHAGFDSACTTSLLLASQSLLEKGSRNAHRPNACQALGSTAESPLAATNDIGGFSRSAFKRNCTCIPISQAGAYRALRCRACGEDRWQGRLKLREHGEVTRLQTAWREFDPVANALVDIEGFEHACPTYAHASHR
jgi:hypothetical protein